MKKSIITVLLLMSFGSVLCGQSTSSSSMEQVGTSVANILKVGVGARSLAMGNAAVADCDDISSLYWNAGALARIEKNEIIFHQSSWLVDSKIYFFGMGFIIPSVGTIGLSLNYFSSGDIEETTLEYPEGTGRTFTADDFSVGITFSRKITDRFSTGVTVKMIQESLDKENASTFAIDIGSVFTTNFLNNMRIGMSLSNLGGQMKFTGTDLAIQYTANPDNPTKVVQGSLETDEWDIPLYFRFGLATEAFDNDNFRLTLSTEVMDSRDYIHRIAVGGEFSWIEMFFLRAGYQFNTDDTNFSVGGGLKLDLKWADFRLDYAYTNMGIFSDTQKFSIIFAF